MIKQQALKAGLTQYLACQFAVTPEEATPAQIHAALSRTLMGMLMPTWRESTKLSETSKCAHYFSAEFLVGRAIYNNLLCLQATEQADAVLKECGLSLAALEEIEDAALGNGGLGRLAACFLDSAATLALPLDGYGIRYRYGLFKQQIENGFQKEAVDDWARYGDPWSVRRDSDTVTVQFADTAVQAVPYDIPILGYGAEFVGNLRLWQAEPVDAFDFGLFNDQQYDAAMQKANRAQDISRVLYPNDTTPEGKRLRLRQQYFFTAASLKDILTRHKRRYNTLENLGELHAIQLNDTHPVIGIPELLRLLCDDEGMSFEHAWGITSQVFCYTNHTVMSEALEKWDIGLIKEILPRIAQIILQIDTLLSTTLEEKAVDKSIAESMAIVQKDAVHMAHLAIFGTRMVNGVAKLHSEILKNDLFKDWYALYPERFCNKTNGITQRRWLALCNPELSALITRLLGRDDWKKDLSLLRQLETYADDPEVLGAFCDIKRKKKEDLAAYILEKEGVQIHADWILDVQIKRLHEYKRQLLNILAILALYFELRNGRLKDFTPTVFLFGAKSAPGYQRAKGIIKLINQVGALIAQDEKVREKMQVVFISNYNVSYAEKIVAAAQVSEQISTAGTEASGTGNMKLMLSGAVTLGTFDGANVEIVEEAGEENEYIFGATVEEIRELEAGYDPRVLYKASPRIKKVLDALIDGTLDDNGTGMFQDLYDSILKGATWHQPDQYRLLWDFERYFEAKLRVNWDYRDSMAFAHKSWLNVCRGGYFSSDRTIAEYAQEIWGITPVKG